jgi:N-sulfoglucosamine sulfohydrolase
MKPIRRLFSLLLLCPAVLSAQPNLLIITTDDMSCDSVGVYGCKLKDSTPNMDRLAERSLRFNHAHVVVGNCMPSRNVMWSGRYPHNNRIEGFRAMGKQEKNYPVLGDLMKEAGYFTGIRHKVSHSTPYSPFPWDIVLGDEKKDDVKNAASWGQAATKGIEAAKAAGKPFCLMLNIADPHKPFYAEGNRGDTVPDENVPSRAFTAEEVPVPGFLHDDPVIRKELAHYYSSVRRADDSVGAILEALNASGQEERTIIVFLSDHGMPLPFAKTQLYHHSTRTPLMVRWPGVTKDGAVDDEHVISTVDLLPTILDMLDVSKPSGFDGTSFAGVLKGKKEPERTMAFKEYNENSGGQRTPMRSVQTKDYVYIFNLWSNGTRVMSGATAGTSTCRQMRVLAKTDPQIAARIDLFDHRVPEEAYEVSYDPDALTNLIDKPEHTAQVAALEKALEAWMVRTKDPLLEVFRKRDDAAFREEFMKGQEAAQKSRKDRKASNTEMKKAGGVKKGAELIALEIPASVSPGGKAIVKLTHAFPAELGEKPVQVTLKGAGNERIERKEVKASGSGVIEVTFDLPADIPGGKVNFAGLVGTGMQDALQHIQTKPVPVK